MTTASGLALPALAEKSLSVILRYQEANGAYPASPDFSAYSGYCWFRDGSFIADGVSSHGNRDSATTFFDWCAATLERNRGAIERVVTAAEAGRPVPISGMLPARFTVDGELGSDEWWDFQLDGYGTWLWAVTEHAERHGLDTNRWSAAAELSVDYLLSSWRRPCYDWWEENKDEVHVSTLACIGAGLLAAAQTGLVDGERAARASTAADDIRELIETQGTHDGHLVKWLGSHDVDGSLAAAVSPLGFVPADSELGRATIREIERQLSVDGGVHRYLGDVFYGGGQWPLLSCFLGLAKAASGDVDGARALLNWAASTSTDEGLMPEQVDRHLLAPDHQAEWTLRWGTVATPLLWSHAMLLRLDSVVGSR